MRLDDRLRWLIWLSLAHPLRICIGSYQSSRHLNSIRICSQLGLGFCDPGFGRIDGPPDHLAIEKK